MRAVSTHDVADRFRPLTVALFVVRGGEQACFDYVLTASKQLQPVVWVYGTFKKESKEERESERERAREREGKREGEGERERRDKRPRYRERQVSQGSREGESLLCRGTRELWQMRRRRKSAETKEKKHGREKEKNGQQKGSQSQIKTGVRSWAWPVGKGATKQQTRCGLWTLGGQSFLCSGSPAPRCRDEGETDEGEKGWWVKKWSQHEHMGGGGG